MNKRRRLHKGRRNAKKSDERIMKRKAKNKNIGFTLTLYETCAYLPGQFDVPALESIGSYIEMILNVSLMSYRRNLIQTKNGGVYIYRYIVVEIIQKCKNEKKVSQDVFEI
jgi:hypothetical protein